MIRSSASGIVVSSGARRRRLGRGDSTGRLIERRVGATVLRLEEYHVPQNPVERADVPTGGGRHQLGACSGAMH